MPGNVPAEPSLRFRAWSSQPAPRPAVPHPEAGTRRLGERFGTALVYELSALAPALSGAFSFSTGMDLGRMGPDLGRMGPGTAGAAPTDARGNSQALFQASGG